MFVSFVNLKCKITNYQPSNMHTNVKGKTGAA